MAVVVNMLVHEKCMGHGHGHRHRDMDASTGTWMQAQGHGCKHRDMDVSTGTQMWADWKHEHKNKVKKVKTTHQTHCGGRQAGVATTGVARCDQV